MNRNKAGGHVLLVVDDCENDLQIFQRAWRMLDFEWSLSLLRGGKECLDYLIRRNEYSDPKTSPRPSLLILDLQMPGTDGFEVLRQIKSLPALKRLPIVVLSALTSEAVVARCYDLGANAFIVKPPGGSELLAALQKIYQFWQLADLPGLTLTGNEPADDPTPDSPLSAPAR